MKYNFMTKQVLVRLEYTPDQGGEYCVTNLGDSWKGITSKGPVNNIEHFYELQAFFSKHHDDTYAQIFDALDALKHTSCRHGHINFAVTVS